MKLLRQVLVFALIAIPLTALASLGNADVVGIVNATRLDGCGPSAELERLRPDPRLDEAARRLADGQALQPATMKAGYRAKASASIHVASTEGEAGLARILASRFCGILAEPDWHEIGAFRRGEDTWLVLARPLIPPATAADALDDRVLALINKARGQQRRCGSRSFPATAPLRSDAALREAARSHARDMASRGRLGHEGSDGTLPADRTTRAGYAWQAVAENVAAGQPSAEEVAETWLASPGHCRNLMDPRYSDTGIAHAADPGAEKGIYWVQVFAAPE